MVIQSSVLKVILGWDISFVYPNYEWTSLLNMTIMGAFEFMVIIHRWPLQMLEQTFPYHKRCKKLWIMHLLDMVSQQLSNSWIKSFSSMVPTTLEY
jgi:hypothetical protein